MRYRLRTLLIVLTLAPPVLAWAYFIGREPNNWGYIVGAFIFGLLMSLIVLVWRGDLHASILPDKRQWPW